MSKRVHFIGIGGTGLSAIARVLLERGFEVSGSDRELSPLAEGLREAGARVFIGHKAEQVGDADLVIRSSAVSDDNVEVQAAEKAGIKVLKRFEYLGELLADKTTVAVAGAHGKTTTTAMLAWLLTALNQRPGFIAGGTVENLGVNAHSGEGQYFVIEADEYDYMFLGLNPRIAVVTNVEYDHPDFFPNEEDFAQAFRDFVGRIVPGGTLVACLDNPGARQLMEAFEEKGERAISYGLEKKGEAEPDYVARNLRSRVGLGYEFEAFRGETRLAEAALQIPGEHNVSNGLAALAVIDLLGLSVKEAALALGDFRGAGRRFEVLGEVKDVVVVDDYAHHPTEIRATLAAAKSRYPESELWAVWQPHTFSRTETLIEDFESAFVDADHVVVTEVYAAREERPENFSMERFEEDFRHPDIRFIGELAEAATYLISTLRPGSVLLVLSAGDAVQVSSQVLEGLRKMEENYV